MTCIIFIKHYDHSEAESQFRYIQKIKRLELSFMKLVIKYLILKL